jgi:iron complex outermembrane receptor protein
MGKIEQQVDFVPYDKINLSAGIGYEQYHSIPQSADLSAPVNTNDYIHSTYLGTKAFYNPGGVAAQFYFLRYHNVGTFVQSTWSPNDQWHITLGARHDWNSRYGSTFNPRMGIVYKASEKTMIKVLFGSAFLAPMPSDSYAQYGSFYTTDSGRTYRSSFLHLPNPDLKPIRSRNVELSISQNLSENIALTVNGYYTFLSGLHMYADDNLTTKRYNNQFNGIPVDYIEVFTNNNRQFNYGASIVLNGKHRFGKLQFNSFASFSYVNGKLEQGLTENRETELDRQTDFIAPFMGRTGFDLKAGKFTCAPRLTLMGTQRLPGIKDTVNAIIHRQTIPGYALLNVLVRYAFNKNVAGFINVSNALNQRYRAVSFNMDLSNPNTELFYGQRQDPIRIMAGFKWEL